jgi:hypothetical protein
MINRSLRTPPGSPLKLNPTGACEPLLYEPAGWSAYAKSGRVWEIFRSFSLCEFEKDLQAAIIGC